MNYQDYHTEDFILDYNFRNWVLGKDNKSNAFWAEWIEKNPDKLQMIREARQMVLKTVDIKHSISDEKVSDIWKNVSQHISKENTQKQETKLVSISPEAVIYSSVKRLEPAKRNSFNYLWKVAAMLLLVTGFSFLFLKKDVIDQFTATPPTLIVKSNPLGQKSTIYLNDGSEVILNSGSALKYSDDFGIEKREIYLEGEAYFKVAHDEYHPFIVKSGNIETTALGTEFNVRAYEAGEISVALTKGKVSVVGKEEGVLGKDSLILVQGEGVKYGGNHSLKKFQFDEKEYVSWINGILYFHQASEREVIDRLEQWYGVEIEVINESTKKWGYTGEFDRKSLETVLMTMSFAMDFTFTIENDDVKLQYK